MSTPTSTADADQVVARTVEAARTQLGDQLEAIYLLGSLAHGGFAPLVSDIDVAIVLTQADRQSAARMAQVQEHVAATETHPLAERLSLFWGDWEMVRAGTGAHGRLGPVDRLDLLESGRLIAGTDRREPSVRPTPAELVIMSADFILARFGADYLQALTDTATLLAGGVRAVTKAVLFPVRFSFTAATGGLGLNDAAARWYADHELPGAALALEALNWRQHGLGDDEDRVGALLRAELIALYGECIAQFIYELERLGEPARARGLAERGACLPGR